MTLNRFAIYAPYKRKNEYVIVEGHPSWGAFLFGEIQEMSHVRGSSMSEDKELDNMPIWQNHEHRITALEVTQATMKSEFDDIKNRIDKGNDEQSKKLEVIDKRLMDEFFTRKNRNHENTWKLVLKVAGALVGAGSFIYLVLEKLIRG